MKLSKQKYNIILFIYDSLRANIKNGVNVILLSSCIAWSVFLFFVKFYVKSVYSYSVLLRVANSERPLELIETDIEEYDVSLIFSIVWNSSFSLLIKALKYSII